MNCVVTPARTLSTLLLLRLLLVRILILAVTILTASTASQYRAPASGARCRLVRPQLALLAWPAPRAYVNRRDNWVFHGLQVGGGNRQRLCWCRKSCAAGCCCIAVMHQQVGLNVSHACHFARMHARKAAHGGVRQVHSDRRWLGNKVTACCDAATSSFTVPMYFLQAGSVSSTS